MKNRKNEKKLLAFLIVISLMVIITSIPILSAGPIKNSGQHVKTSASEITIVTPENKTYTEPMGGYYPATYGFENDLDGSIAQGWVDNSEPGCTAKVISEKLGHKKVVHLDDNHNETEMDFDNYFPAQIKGTIELWLLIEDMSQGFAIRISNGTSHEFYLAVGYNKWMYVDSTYGARNIPAFDGVFDPVINKWYHLTIHFRCNGAPSYMNLNESRFKVIINGHESSELEAYMEMNFVNKLNFATTGPSTLEYWIDAIGFSWDPGYNLRDNLNKGLLLSFENSITLDWIGYSLDGQANRTILGDVTIPMPTEGFHNIQVYGNNSYGIFFESDIRFFTVSPQSDTIPGYNIIALLGVCCMITLILIKKNRCRMNRS